MTWTPRDMATQLREMAGTACGVYRPDANSECLTCDETYAAHLFRAAAETLDPPTAMSAPDLIRAEIACGGCTHPYHRHLARGLDAPSVCQVEECQCQQFLFAALSATG